MLAGLRNTVQQGLTMLIFGAIIVVFALNFGPGSVSQCGGKLPAAATVNGRLISEADFTRRYAQVYANYAQAMPSFSVEQAKSMGLKSQVMDAMVGEELLAQEAERRGITVPQEELRAEIKKVPLFQKDGKFDKETYKKYARNIALTEAKFEEDYSRQLLSQKMRQALEDLVVVPETEVKEQFINKNNRADIEFVKVDPAAFRKDLKVSDADVQKLIAEDPKAVEEYFNTHAQRYNEPRRVRARHILVKVMEKAADDVEKKAKEKIDQAKARLDKGEDFAAVAREMSEDASAANGGDLGLQGPGVWVKPFEDEANRLKPGETGNIIRSRFGYHIIKVEEVKEASKKELKDVQPEVARLVAEERALKKAAKDKAEKLLADAKAGKKLEELAPPPADASKPDPFTPRTEATGWFQKGAKYVPKLGIAGDIVTAVFAKDAPGLLDKVYDVNGRFYVVNIREREVPDMAKFEEERNEIEEGLKSAARSRVVADFTKAQREKLEASGAVSVDKAVIGYEARPMDNSPNPMDDF